MLLCHVLHLTVVHEHDVANLFCPDSREAGSRRRWLGLLADLTVLDYAIIKTVDALWQVQLAGSASELRCAHVVMLQTKLEQLCPLGESLMKFQQRRWYQTIKVQLALRQNFSFFAFHEEEVVVERLLRVLYELEEVPQRLARLLAPLVASGLFLMVIL